jgi:hypothetical protein
VEANPPAPVAGNVVVAPNEAIAASDAVSFAVAGMASVFSEGKFNGAPQSDK